MNIEEKIILSEDWDNIYFFTEGIFAQVFGVSLYLTVTRLNLPIKPQNIAYKKLGHKMILRAGLPSKQLQTYCPNLIKQDFGFQLRGRWLKNDTEYQKWYAAQFNALIDKKNIENSIKTRQLLLTEKEYIFLKNWQRGIHSTYIESLFIERLSDRVSTESKNCVL